MPLVREVGSTNSRSAYERPGVRQQVTNVRQVAPSTRAIIVPRGVDDRCSIPRADGGACGARPIKGTSVCVGHKRQAVAHADKG
jgi:hypothetical protein